MPALWKEGSLILSEFNQHEDFFQCPVKWHTDDPDFLRGFGRFTRKGLTDAPGWIIKKDVRTQFIQALRARCSPRTYATAVEPAPLPPPPMFGSDSGPSVPAPITKVKARPRVHLSTTTLETSPVKFAEDTQISLKELLTVERPNDTTAEGKLYLMSKDTAMLCAKVAVYEKDGYSIYLWCETVDGALCVLQR